MRIERGVLRLEGDCSRVVLKENYTGNGSG